MCDNCKSPREKVSVEAELQTALQAVADLREEFKIKTLVDFVLTSIRTSSFNKKS